MKRNNNGNIVFLDPKEYFHAAVSGAVGSLNLRVTQHAQHYLVNLLFKNIAVENVFPTDAEGKPAETLAQQLAIALEEEKIQSRAKRLQELGDFSLYVAGFFSDSLNRKSVDIDYYIGMGGAAYENAARLEKKKKAELLLELANRFSDCVDVLSQISEECGFSPADPKDLLRVYELWNKTGSDRLAKQLTKAGIIPIASVASKKKNGTDDS